jgi:hypothetical protein
MAVYWRVRFDDPRDDFGWLKLVEDSEPILLNDDGTSAEDVTGYTTIDTEPVPPEWA